MNKIKIRNLVCFMLIACSSWAQTLNPSIITTQGGNYIAGGNQLSWTTGGLVTQTLTAGGYILTQSFQQPELQVWTGAIGPSGLCPGTVINVPYIQSGIVSNSNNFIAELSNASGSFASPVTVGTLAGKINGTIACTIPLATPAGTGYRIRVRSTLPAFTGPDNGNNVAVWAKPTCSITPVPDNNVYTGGIPTNIYLGYGPQKLTLNATASGGAPFSYSWAGNGSLSCYTCTAPVFAPTTAGLYTFTLTVTNANGCKSTCSISVCVTDIRSSDKKVYICHNGNTQSVSPNAVSSHIPGHANDRLGRCDQQPPCAAPLMITKGNAQVEEELAEVEALTVAAMPNPTRDYFNLQIKSTDRSTPAIVRIMDVYGRVLLVRTGVDANSSIRLGEKLYSGTYLVNVQQGKKERTVKLIKIN